MDSVINRNKNFIIELSTVLFFNGTQIFEQHSNVMKTPTSPYIILLTIPINYPNVCNNFNFQKYTFQILSC